MPFACVKDQPASCGHAQTGSSRVLMSSKGACRVGLDTAGGIISGPGSRKVFIEGYPASLPGDAIAGHGKTPHSSPVTVNGQFKVNIG
jgi:uncharacterized Zn-binding protein involved in type VI secretion